MTKPAFKQGQIVYLASGQKARYLGAIEKLQDRDIGEHVVQLLYTAPMYRGFDEEPYEEEIDGDIQNAHRVYAEPPTPALDSQIKQDREQLEALGHSIREAMEKKLEAKRDLADTLKTLAKYEPLRHIRDILDGKVTHVITRAYPGYKVTPWAEADLWKHHERGRDRFRLISLHAEDKEKTGTVKEAKKYLSWHISDYSDGSGTDREIWFYFSEEEANAKAREMMQADLNRAVENSKEVPQDRHAASILMSRFINVAKAAKEMGIDIGHNAEEALANHEAEQQRKALDQAKGDAKRAQEKLAALTSS